MFKLVRLTVFRASCSICSACKDDMLLFPAVSVLGNTQVHVCAPNGSNVSTYINAPVDD